MSKDSLKTKFKNAIKKKNSDKEAAAVAAAQATIEYSFKMLCIIAEHGTADDITELLSKYGTQFNMLCSGKGTANSKLMALLGLGEVDKDVVLSIIPSEKCAEILKKIKEEISTSGIAFTTKLTSIGGRNTIKLLRGEL